MKCQASLPCLSGDTRNESLLCVGVREAIAPKPLCKLTLHFDVCARNRWISAQTITELQMHSPEPRQ